MPGASWGPRASDGPERGRCLNNARMGEAETKLGVYGRHRFCLVMENALNHDYVSEKLWDAFAGGCVPVYYVRPTPASALLQHGCQRACSDVRRCLPVSALQAGKPRCNVRR